MDLTIISQTLQRLPLVNPPRATKLITPILQELNLAHFSVLERNDFLESIHDTLDMVIISTRETKERELNCLADQCQIFLVKSYFDIAKQIISTQKSLKTNMQVIACLHRSLYHLQQCQQYNCQIYKKPPAQWWLLLNEIYKVAEAKQLLAGVSFKHTMQGEFAASLEDIYKQCVLLACVGPSHLSQNEMTGVFALVKKWAPLVKINVPTLKDDQFLINLDYDSAPVPHEFKHDVVPGNQRSFDVKQLLPECHRLRQLLFKIPDQTMEMDGVAITTDFVQRVISSLGERPKRKFHRVSVTGSVTLSLQVTGEDDLAQETQWHIVNASPEGYGLRSYAALPLDFTVGSLIKVRENQNASWQLGVFRWVEVDDNGYIKVGVELLSPQFKPIKIAVGKKGEFVSGLLLPALKAIRDIDILVIPNRLVNSGDVVMVSNDNVEYQVQLSAPVERNTRFSQFHFSLAKDNGSSSQ